MDSSRLFESHRHPYAPRQTPSMQLSTNLSSGQAYYTLESLEGSSALPLLKPSSTSLPSERDALLHLDAQTRAWIAEKESLDARAWRLAAEREAILGRSLPGISPADARPYATAQLTADARLQLALDAQLPPVDARLPSDVDPRLHHVDIRLQPAADVRLPSVDVRSRLDGRPPVDIRSSLSRFDELPNLDSRATALPHGLNARLNDPLWPGVDNRVRAQQMAAGLAVGAQDHVPLSELIRARELSAGARGGVVPYLPRADSLYAQREIEDVRASTLPSDPFLTRAGINARQSVSSLQPRSERTLTTTLPKPQDSAHKAALTPQNNKGSIKKEKAKPLPGQSEGWCDVCKLECYNLKNLGIHLTGKKHKAALERSSDELNKAAEQGKSKAATSQADKKRASEARPETSKNAKRQKTTAPATAGGHKITVSAATANGAPNTGAATAKNPKEDLAKKSVAQSGKGSESTLVCNVCNIFVTGPKNLETHLKGKRHAARVKELAGSS